MVKAASFCVVGFEDVAKFELDNFDVKNINTSEGFVSFETKDYSKIAEIAYFSRTASRVISVFDELNISKKIDKEPVLKSVNNLDFEKWFNDGTTFRVECERVGEHEFNSADVEKLFGGLIIDSVFKKLGFKPTVALDNPDIIIYVDIFNDRLLYGVDFCGFDLAKRDYHIFVTKTAIRGNVGASIVLYANVKDKKTILDTMSASGTIPIEAALISKGFSVNRFRKENFVFKKLKVLSDVDFNNFFDSIEKKVKEKNWEIIASDPVLANVMSTNKNAKIAEVAEFINTTRIDFDWLDIKIQKNNVDAIITKMPAVSASNTVKDIEKIYKEFFYQAEYILKKSGKIVCLLLNDELFCKIGKDYKFDKVDFKKIMIGKQQCVVVTLEFEKKK